MTENNPDYNYYTIANTIIQLDSDYWYDNLEYWTAMGAHNADYPTETDYNPGPDFVEDVEAFSVFNACNAPCSGTSMSTGWFNQWCGQWSINEQRTYDPVDNNGWSMGGHDQLFYATTSQCEDSASRGRGYDWELATFASAWTVPANAPAAVGVHSMLFYCTGFWDCFDGTKDYERSKVQYYIFNEDLNSGDPLCPTDPSAKTRTTYGEADRTTYDADAVAREGAQTTPPEDAGVKVACGVEGPLLPPPNVGELVPAGNPAEDPECGWEPLYPDCDPSTPTDPEYWMGQWGPAKTTADGDPA